MILPGTVSTVSTVSIVETLNNCIIILQYNLIHGRRKRSYLLGFKLSDLCLTATALLTGVTKC